MVYVRVGDYIYTHTYIYGICNYGRIHAYMCINMYKDGRIYI